SRSGVATTLCHFTPPPFRANAERKNWRASLIFSETQNEAVPMDWDWTEEEEWGWAEEEEIDRLIRLRNPETICSVCDSRKEPGERYCPECAEYKKRADTLRRAKARAKVFGLL